MKPRPRKSPTADYLQRFAAQTQAFGRHGQLRLRDAHVVIVGAGGVGTAVCLTLAGVGIGRITVIDPQVVEPDNFNRFVFARDSDWGTSKVGLLGRVLKDRPHLEYEGLESSCFSRGAQRLMAKADILVSTSNTVPSRRFVARFASRHQVAHVFAGVEDSRIGFSGSVGAWSPKRRDLACQACYLAPSAHRPSLNASIVTTAVTQVGSLAAHLVVRLLTASNKEAVMAAGNLLSLNLDTWQLEGLVVRRRPSCRACGTRPGRPR